jgi:hypothetical protein
MDLFQVLLGYTNNIHIECDPYMTECIADPHRNMTKLNHCLCDNRTVSNKTM